ncbi:MAG: hypothetical protein Kow00123_18340 [Anaerolineales bacterium]
MATEDEQIALAKRIAKDLPEVSRNEWMRWMQMARAKGLERAIAYAQRLSNDMTMRPAIQRANRLIAQVVGANKQALARLSPDDQAKVLGYVGWRLKVQEGPRKSEPKPTGKPRHGKHPR